jgi:hypothetical protein
VLYCCEIDCIGICPMLWSWGIWKAAIDGVNGDGAVLVVALAAPEDEFGNPAAWRFSSLVIANPLGTFPDALAFLFLLGPTEPEGEPWRDMLFGVIVVEVACDV